MEYYNQGGCNETECFPVPCNKPHVKNDSCQQNAYKTTKFTPWVDVYECKGCGSNNNSGSRSQGSNGCGCNGGGSGSRSKGSNGCGSGSRSKGSDSKKNSCYRPCNNKCSCKLYKCKKVGTNCPCTQKPINPCNRSQHGGYSSNQTNW